MANEYRYVPACAPPAPPFDVADPRSSDLNANRRSEPTFPTMGRRSRNGADPVARRCGPTRPDFAYTRWESATRWHCHDGRDRTRRCYRMPFAPIPPRRETHVVGIPANRRGVAHAQRAAPEL